MKADWVTRLFVGLLLAEVAAFALSFWIGEEVMTDVGMVSMSCMFVAAVRLRTATDSERRNKSSSASIYYLVVTDLYFGLDFFVEHFGRSRVNDEIIHGATFVILTFLLALIFLIYRKQQHAGGNLTNDAEA